MLFRLFFLISALIFFYSNAQNNHHKRFLSRYSLSKSDGHSKNLRPKLVVGIVVDQMREEYLYRFADNYSEKGFKRLLNKGFEVRNMNYNYVPTSTGPGHASIYSGTTPATHGIISNNWYDRKTKKTVYCVQDDEARLVDNNVSEKVNAYSRSPKNLQTSNIGDELKLFTNDRSKVISISIKDRAAILPGGHLANYAFWLNTKNGHFITSDFYTKSLPKWLKDFNQRNVTDSLLNLVWDTYLPMNKYVNSTADNAPFEKKFKKRRRPTFPYKLSRLRDKKNPFALIATVPYGNTLITQMAKATIKNEKLGQREDEDITDFLAISFSSTDYIGHNFGIRSKELEDVYVRLDYELSELLAYLDSSVGENNYLLFLTADHGASDNSEFLKSRKQKGGFYNPKDLKDTLNDCLSEKLGKGDYVSWVGGKGQIFLNDKNKAKALIATRNCFSKTDGLREVFIPSDKKSLNNSIMGEFVKNAFNPKRSPDIYLQFDSGWMAKRNYGTTHGTSYSGDTHVPMLWYGWHVKHGVSVKKYAITQIVPTLSMMLNIPFPTGSALEPIEELFN